MCDDGKYFFYFIRLITIFWEAVVQRCSVKKMLVQISQNSQENTCARVSGLQLYQQRVASGRLLLEVNYSHHRIRFTYWEWMNIPVLSWSVFIRTLTKLYLLRKDFIWIFTWANNCTAGKKRLILYLKTGRIKSFKILMVTCKGNCQNLSNIYCTGELLTNLNMKQVSENT